MRAGRGQSQGHRACRRPPPDGRRGGCRSRGSGTHRPRSGGGGPTRPHGARRPRAFPARRCVSVARLVDAVDVVKQGDLGLPAGLPVSTPDHFRLQGCAKAFKAALAIGLEPMAPRAGQSQLRLRLIDAVRPCLHSIFRRFKRPLSRFANKPLPGNGSFKARRPRSVPPIRQQASLSITGSERCPGMQTSRCRAVTRSHGAPALHGPQKPEGPFLIPPRQPLPHSAGKPCAGHLPPGSNAVAQTKSVF